MPILPDPMIIPPGTPDPEFWYNSQLTDLFSAAMNLNLTSRSGAIQNNDKAGNLSAVYCVFTSHTVANTEDPVEHTLGRIPVGYFAVRQNKASGGPYDSGPAFTENKLFLKTPASSVTWTLLVF